MSILDVDPELTRQLATDVARNAQGSLPAPPVIPIDAATHDFGAHLAAAVTNINQRTERLRADLAHISRAGYALAAAAAATDEHTAGRFSAHAGGS